MRKLLYMLVAVFAIALMFSQDAEAQMTHGFRLNDEYSAQGGSGVLSDWVILTPQANGTYKREFRDYNMDWGWCYPGWDGSGPPRPPCRVDDDGMGFSNTVTTYISGSAASAEIGQKYQSASWSSGYTSF